MKLPLWRLDIADAGGGGYDCLELLEFELESGLSDEERRPRVLADLFQRHRVSPFRSTRSSGRTWPARRNSRVKAECHRLCGLAAKTGCEYVIAVPATKPAATPAKEVFDQLVRSLRELAVIAGSAADKLAFEFLGFPDCSVREAFRIVWRSG